MMLAKLLKAVAVAAAVALSATAMGHAAEGKSKKYEHPHFSWEGIFGHFEQDQLQRGYQVYREVCAACHSMELVAFRHLGQKGGPYYLEECPAELGLPASTDCSDPVQNPIVRSIAADFMIQDGPDEFGDMFERPGIPADYLPSPYDNKNAAANANGGAYPPDMSLLAKARKYGPQYIYSLLIGYPEVNPVALDVPPGQYYNPYYKGDTVSILRPEYLDENGEKNKDLIRETVDPTYVASDGSIYGGVFKMANPMRDGQIEYEDGTPGTVEQYSLDVTAFLMWAAEPKLEERKTMGRFVILYLLIFAAIVYASYRQIWRRVH